MVFVIRPETHGKPFRAVEQELTCFRQVGLCKKKQRTGSISGGSRNQFCRDSSSKDVIATGLQIEPYGSFCHGVRKNLLLFESVTK
jgi:hypothetical protein